MYNATNPTAQLEKWRPKVVPKVSGQAQNRARNRTQTFLCASGCSWWAVEGRLSVQEVHCPVSMNSQTVPGGKAAEQL